MMLGILFTALLYNSDIIILNYFSFDKEKIGIFASYQGIIKLVFYVGFYEIFTVVFLPTIANMDRKAFFYKINNLSWLIFIIVFFSAALIIIICLLIFGKKYVFSPIYLLMSSISIGIFTLYQINNALITMEGEKGARWSFLVSLSVLPVSFFLQILFTKLWGVSGIMAALILTNACLLGIMQITIRKFYKNKLPDNF
jgi:O-antigen/teichoic acid export membrane protein